MKKITNLAIMVSALAMNLSADTNDFHIGASSAKIFEKDYTEFNLGYGFNFNTQNNIHVGIAFDIAFGNVDLENNKSAVVVTTGGDLKIGYALFENKLALYAIGSGAYQSVDSLNAVGFGYGGGVDYQITKNIALNVEYKTYDMTSKGADYTYEKINSNLKYTF